MNLKIDGKRAVVSGSTKGIGFAIAKLLAAEGAKVIVNGRTQKSVDQAMAELKSALPSGQFQGVAADLSTKDGVDSLVRQVPDAEIVVNNMGIFEPKPFAEITDADWMKFFEANVMSGVRLSRAYLPGMLKRNWGRIVFISSESGIQIPAEMVHYGMTKTAQLAVSRGLAETVAGTGITVNSVLPGPTKSEGVEQFVDKISGGKPFAAFETDFFKPPGRRRCSSDSFFPKKSQIWSRMFAVRCRRRPTEQRCAWMAAWCGRVFDGPRARRARLAG